MDKIIINIYEIEKHSLNLIEVEENLRTYMCTMFSEAIEEILSKINQTKKDK